MWFKNNISYLVYCYIAKLSCTHRGCFSTTPCKWYYSLLWISSAVIFLQIKRLPVVPSEHSDGLWNPIWTANLPIPFCKHRDVCLWVRACLHTIPTNFWALSEYKQHHIREQTGLIPATVSLWQQRLVLLQRSEVNTDSVISSRSIRWGVTTASKLLGYASLNVDHEPFYI